MLRCVLLVHPAFCFSVLEVVLEFTASYGLGNVKFGFLTLADTLLCVFLSPALFLSFLLFSPLTPLFISFVLLSSFFITRSVLPFSSSLYLACFLSTVVFSYIKWPYFLNLLLMSLFHVYCLWLPSFNLHYLSLPSSLSASSHVHLRFSPPSLHLLSFSFPPSSLYRRYDPHITHHELLRWNPALLCCPTNHRPPLRLCFLSSYPLSPLYWWFCSSISTSGGRSDHIFVRVTWDLVFFHSFGANPEEFWPL